MENIKKAYKINLYDKILIKEIIDFKKWFIIKILKKVIIIITFIKEFLDIKIISIKISTNKKKLKILKQIEKAVFL